LKKSCLKSLLRFRGYAKKEWQHFNLYFADVININDTFGNTVIMELSFFEKQVIDY